MNEQERSFAEAAVIAGTIHKSLISGGQ